MAQQPGNAASPAPYLRPVRFGAPLPQPIATFVGRSREIREIGSMLGDPGVRLLTLVGPGGVGKTRLAVQAAMEVGESFGLAMYFIPLAALESPTGLLGQIAATLDAGDGGARPVIESIRALVRNQPTLMILDNVEHLLPEAATIVGELLSACQSVSVLATSRSPLRIYGEHRFPVSPLPVTLPADDGTALAEDQLPDGIRLFALRARASDPHFSLTDTNLNDIVEICGRLDGLPLAIELAAARMAEVPPRLYLQRLLRHLPVPGGGSRDMPKRQQTMSAAVGWGYDLLDPDEKRMLRRLAVLAGEFDLDAAEAMAIDIVGEGVHERDGGWSTLDLVLRLVESSLLQRRTDDSGDLRFQMLETIRDFVLGQVQAEGEYDTLLRRHACHYLDQTIAANNKLLTGRDLVQWLGFIDDRVPNIRSAMGWAASHDPAMLVEFTRNLMQYWLRRSRMREGIEWLGRAHELDPDLTEVERGWVLANLGRLHQYAETGEVVPLYCEALAIAHAHEAPELELTVRIGQVMEAALRGRHEEAAAALDAARNVTNVDQVIRRITQPKFLEALDALVAGVTGDTDRAEEVSKEVLQRAAAEGDEIAPGMLCLILGAISRGRGDFEASRVYLLRALETYEAVQEEWNVGNCLMGLARLFLMDHPELSVRLAGAADRLFAIHGEHRVDMKEGTFMDATDDLRQRRGENAVKQAWERGAEEPWSLAVADARTTPVDRRDDALASSQRAPRGVGGILSTREVQVLRLLADGLTDREIAAQLGLSYRTITTYVSHILTKLDVPSRTAAVSLAVRQRLIDS